MPVTSAPQTDPHPGALPGAAVPPAAAPSPAVTSPSVPPRAVSPATVPPAARVVIVGAGQAGLSVAYHLRRRGFEPGRDLVILDRGPTTGGAWQFRWESLRLGTAHRVNDLPGMGELGLSFETADRERAARDVVEEYYREYERHFDLRVVRPVAVRSVSETNTPARETDAGMTQTDTPVRETDAGVRESPDPVRESAHHPLEVTTDRGTVRTDVVVNASGTWGRPFRPAYPGAESFRGVQLDTTGYRRAADFAGMRVVVVGAGTSAVGFLLELEHVASSTLWVTRRPVEFLSEDASTSAGAGAGLEGRLAAVAQQQEAAEAGRVLPSIVSGTGLPATGRNLAGLARGVLVAKRMFRSIEPDGVRFSDGSFERADVIIWATGFRSELSHLAPLHLHEPAGGIAVVRGQSIRNPRVFFAGYGPQASTIGANRAGRIVALGVIQTLQA